ncbi:MAG: hypothetical protein HFH68_00210 [Lachnospiraceae bacterium]|nr:hypothetical protein [Lachnospiraceae bacterium]
MHEDEKATSNLYIRNTHKVKNLGKIFKHQLKLTFIQYIISFFTLIVGVLLYIFIDDDLRVGLIKIKDIKVQQLEISSGAILILISLFMITKITLDLNLKIEKEEKTND